MQLENLEQKLLDRVLPVLRLELDGDMTWSAKVEFISNRPGVMIFHVVVKSWTNEVQLDRMLNVFRSYETGYGSTTDPIVIDNEEFIIGDGDDHDAVRVVQVRSDFTIARIWLRYFED